MAADHDLSGGVIIRGLANLRTRNFGGNTLYVFKLKPQNGRHRAQAQRHGPLHGLTA
jgi:hypothetical protein